MNMVQTFVSSKFSSFYLNFNVVKDINLIFQCQEMFCILENYKHIVFIQSKE